MTDKKPAKKQPKKPAKKEVEVQIPPNHRPAE